MSRKYKEELDKIVMTDQMKKRILHNVLNQEQKEQKAKRSILLNKKSVEVMAASLLMAVSLTAAKNYVDIFNNKNSNVENEQSHEEKADSYESDNIEEQSTSNDEDLNEGKQNPYDNSTMSEIDKDNFSGNIKEKEYNQGNAENKYKSDDISDAKEKSNDAKDNSISLKDFKEDKSKLNYKADNNTENVNKIESSTSEDNSNKRLRSASIEDNSSSSWLQHYNSINEAEKAADVKSSSIEKIAHSYDVDSISVISDQIVQIKYNNGKDYINFRAGKNIDNISGDYNSYKIENDININGTEIKISGNSNEKVNLAVWQSENISYSMSSDEGINQSEITEMIKDILN